MTIADAIIKEKSRNNPDEFFARNIAGTDFYFVQRDAKDSASCLYHDFLIEKANRNGFLPARCRLNVYSDRRAVVIPPREFLEIHRDNAVYVVKTNFNPHTLCSPYDAYIREFMQAVKKFNDFLDYPMGVVLYEFLRIAETSGFFLLLEEENSGLVGAIEKAVSGEAVSKEHTTCPARRFERKVHLIVDSGEIGRLGEREYAQLAARIPNLKRKNLILEQQKAL